MRALRLVAVLLTGLLAVAVPALADMAQVDPGRVMLGFEGRDRGRPRPIALAIGLSQAVPYAVAVIDAPPRLVVDLRDTGIPSARPPGAEPLALRWGPGPQGGARAVLTLPGPMNLETAQMTAGASPALSLRLVPVKPADFRPRRDSLTVLRGLPEPSATAPAVVAGKRLLVVLDPGHGGIDPGAQVGELSEARLMLDFARELAAVLRERGIEVVLTREDDSFVPLEARTSVARARGADLFISLHADALPAGQAAGAAIYTWDARSNDRAARQLVLLHDRSDMLAGLDLSGTDEDVSRALFDLARLDTQPRSADAARQLVARLDAAGVDMHRVPIRGAAFSVLKSPDIPSVLIELGFLTDPDDRANLLDPGWRSRVAGALADGVVDWTPKGMAPKASDDAPDNTPDSDARFLPQ
ncbi:N-acetylmuramoyl-L-alanine amidase [Paracoccus alkenifer]|uniref:N-acetylmuramoyl-L-alanine amidase n=1 Tax=Paracoccus alkenifer TaxID=65735 RepID=A0A1H6L331_9RHOB|nr:N-acetylmuramoyl-L-alanine amidase [Paracoccus alkenifer]